MTTTATDRLAELIEQKHACLVLLHSMSRKQLELVEGGEITALLDVLAAKQRLIGVLQKVERALDPFRGQSPDERSWPTPRARDKSASHLAECETLLAEIMTQEKQAESELTRRRDEAARQLQGAHFAGQARGAYTSPPQPGVNQLDLSSGD